MEKILIIASKYSVDSNDGYLTNDLVNEFLRREFNLTVVAYGSSDYYSNKELLNEHIIGLTSKIKYWKYFLVWAKLTSIMIKIIYKQRDFDRILMFGPLTIMWPASFLVRMLKCINKTVIIFDIFPIHQVKINAIPTWLCGVLKKIEIFLLNSFDEVIVMGRRNRAYISRYYSKSKSVLKIKEINLWGSSIDAKKMSPYECGPVKLIFGGQVIKGRRLESLIEFVTLLNSRGLNLTLDLFSNGAYYNDLKVAYSSLSWLNFKPTIPRDTYKEILSNYHVGVLVTDNQADLPAFPSKIIDYASAGLYILGIVEKESELFDVVERFEKVHLNTFNFSNTSLQDAEVFIKKVVNNTASSETAQLEAIFDVSSAVERILN